MKTKIILFYLALIFAIPCVAHTTSAYNERPMISENPIKNANETQWWNFFKKKKHERIWKGVHPDMRTKLEAVYSAMAQRGFDIRPMEGLRSEARQASLLASGSGVTTVGAGMSCHNHGYAIDSVMYVDGKPTWDMDNQHVRDGYLLFGEMVQAVGLEWGGAWTTIKDYPHVEMQSECRVAIRAKPSGQKPPVMVADPMQLPPDILLASFVQPSPNGTICTFDSPCEQQIFFAAMMCPTPLHTPEPLPWSVMSGYYAYSWT